jgi:hypothetical protein
MPPGANDPPAAEPGTWTSGGIAAVSAVPRKRAVVTEVLEGTGGIRWSAFLGPVDGYGAQQLYSE